VSIAFSADLPGAGIPIERFFSIFLINIDSQYRKRLETSLLKLFFKIIQIAFQFVEELLFGSLYPDVAQFGFLFCKPGT